MNSRLEAKARILLKRWLIVIFAVMLAGPLVGGPLFGGPLLGGLAGTALAQDARTSRPFSHITADWARALDSVQLDIVSPVQSRRTDQELRTVLEQVRTEALDEKTKAEAEMESVDKLIDALGPVPAEGEAAEPEQLQQRRAEFVERRDFYRARIAESEVALTRVDELQHDIALRARERDFADLLHVYPLPFMPGTVAKAVPEFTGIVSSLAQSPQKWWETLSLDLRAAAPARVLFVLVLAVIFGWVLRRLLLRFFGRDPKLAEPTYARRLIGAVAQGVANAIIPALLFAGVLLRVVSGKTLVTGLFGDLVLAFCAAMIFFIPAVVLPRAVLVPHQPAWRLLPIAPHNARAITRRITLLAAIYAAAILFRLGTVNLQLSVEVVSLWVMTVSLLLALGIVDLTRSSLWSSETAAETTGEAETRTGEGAIRSEAFWPTVRFLARAIIITAVLVSLAGYTALSNFLYVNLLYSALVLGVLFLLHGLLRELIGVLTRSFFMQRRLSVRHGARIRLKFWGRAALDLLVYLTLGLALVAIWGTPFDDLWEETRRLLQGFSVGNVTISFVDILVALVIFALALVATRMLQRLRSEKVLPHTNLDSGVQHSLSAGVGYLGITLAAVVGIVALGIDLSSIALIAGALSVGIGFGLQNVVNNFVSGLILLVERPIKIGDWVVAGANEGFVKRINVRATELETFQRASVIIPNAELLSTSVVNWTHKDRNGRIEVGVGVAYGSDTQKVQQILLEAAQAHDRVMNWPEPFVIFRNFGDSSLDFELRCFTSDVYYMVIIASDLRFEIDRRFREEGIEIPFPQRVVHFAGAPADDGASGFEGPPPETASAGSGGSAAATSGRDAPPLDGPEAAGDADGGGSQN